MFRWFSVKNSFYNLMWIWRKTDLSFEKTAVNHHTDHAHQDLCFLSEMFLTNQWFQLIILLLAKKWNLHKLIKQAY